MCSLALQITAVGSGTVKQVRLFSIWLCLTRSSALFWNLCAVCACLPPERALSPFLAVWVFA